MLAWITANLTPNCNVDLSITLYVVTLAAYCVTGFILTSLLSPQVTNDETQYTTDDGVRRGMLVAYSLSCKLQPPTPYPPTHAPIRVLTACSPSLVPDSSKSNPPSKSRCSSHNPGCFWSFPCWITPFPPSCRARLPRCDVDIFLGYRGGRTPENLAAHLPFFQALDALLLPVAEEESVSPGRGIDLL